MAEADITVTLPAALLSLFPGAPRRVSVSALTVRGLLDELDRRWPGMRDRLSDSSPAIRRHIRVIVQGDLADLDTRLSNGDEVFVLTAVSGG